MRIDNFFVILDGQLILEVISEKSVCMSETEYHSENKLIK